MKTTYDKDKINAYLLGVLPENEAETFDELSFTDDDFADELSAAEKDLVDAYVRNELRGTTLEHFKDYYLASPIRREKVKFAETFQQFAAKKEKRTFAEILTGFFAIPKISLQWGFAFAALVLLILGGWFYTENSRLRFEMEQAKTNREKLLQRENELTEREKQLQAEIADQQTANSETEKELAKVREEREKLAQELKNQKATQPQIAEKRENIQPKTSISPSRQISVASFILAPSLRGTNNLQSLSIAPKTDTAAMKLELEADDYAFYRVRLQNQSDGKILWQSGKIKSRKSGANSFLNVSFSAKLLKSNIYTLEVSGVTANGAEEIFSNYSFRIMR
ncbi:MAG TPA: hypothetical protein PKY59_19290 [Pyrinomonadaceae bacterium]|nr:hypothetical protein [Pyrinomonadaceae bacterium]